MIWDATYSVRDLCCFPAVRESRKAVSPMEEHFLELAISSWRFLKAASRAVYHMDAGRKRGFESQIRWYESRLREALEAGGWIIPDYENQPYDPGLPVKPINLDDFDAGAPLFIETVLEPVVMGQEGIVRTGSVMLRR